MANAGNAGGVGAGAEEERADNALRRRKPPSPDELQKNESLYEIAYDEARRALDDQTSELNNIRTRAVGYLAFTGAATAFLAGTGIHSGRRDAAFYAMTIVAYGLALIVIALVALLLSPWTTPLRKRVDAKLLLARWIERDVPVANKADMLREMALWYDEWRRSNESRLDRVRKIYVAAIALGAIQLVGWSILVWIST
jgi:hypothetical protein